MARQPAGRSIDDSAATSSAIEVQKQSKKSEKEETGSSSTFGLQGRF
jgi:hypothetical protein